jgi:hypothetical protein
MRKKCTGRPCADRPVLCKGATLQLHYGVGRGFESGRLGIGLIGFGFLPGTGGGTSVGSRSGMSCGSGTGTSVGSGRTGRTGVSGTGSSMGKPGERARAWRMADMSEELNIKSYIELFGLAQNGRATVISKKRFILFSSSPNCCRLARSSNHER